ncbi:MAG: NAD-binding protein [Deltaproteobacteria bacterium]|nr:MAG: NAD-binding protein [Deltaproteobacteria bacterium]
MESFWILGAGRFGSLALARILQLKKDSQVLIVDRDRRSLRELGEKGVEIIEQDAIDFLLERSGQGPEWVVPAIPIHVAFAWLCRRLGREGRVKPLPVPSIVDHQVPNPMREEANVLYASIATFRCPDNCDEPVDCCTVTGEPRLANLFDVFRRIEIEGYLIQVIRSHQLAPGVGGYQLSILWRLLEEMRSTERDVLIATACRCHGVINALRWQPTRK